MGLSWPFLGACRGLGSVTIFFFFFFCLESRANKFFYLFEGVPNFVTEGVPKYRANIKNFNYYIQKNKNSSFLSGQGVPTKLWKMKRKGVELYHQRF